ncbi:survival motor neuron protein 1-like [Lingula anatina]|uniref:Survival motor neuron protein 1-like n=1 Tax=Lingula anatina TaxID=7574 RepID=A0A1S3KIM0_LINAN|nr:survival motor neuron protein 1-like [Lingula anatina]|eukprot:XP_013422056.1 survival motor neuron protein 1-like [Lingula anatina]
MQSSEASLFVRGEDTSEIWDDTALIKAYDHAVSSVKAHLSKKNGDSIQSLDHSTGDLVQKKKHKKNKKKHKHKGRKQWKVGDQCRAVFTEDDTIYDAVIVSLSEEVGTCVVRYLDYNNEETQKLADLLAPNRRHQRRESGSNAESDMDCTPGPHRGSRPHRQSESHAPPPTWPWPQSPNVIPPFSAMPPVFPSLPVFPPWTSPAQTPLSSQNFSVDIYFGYDVA